MDAQTFDRLIAEAARRPSRRTALRLLGASLMGALLPARLASAQRPDSDGDGLFDDDETNIYGTEPAVFDTDADGIGDGEEVYLGTDPLAGGQAAPAPVGCAQLGASCAAAECCAGYCGQDLVCGCIRDSEPCYPEGAGGCCNGQPCNADGYCGVCGSIGTRCNSDVDCCQGNFPALCCFNGTVLDTVCTDVSNTGYVCPGDAPAPGGCPAGQTDCGGTCVDLTSHAGHCGACFASCALGGICHGGVCGVSCLDGRTDCGGFCADLQTDFDHCGACGHSCANVPGGPLDCVGGACLDVSEEPAAPGGGGDDIDDVENKADPCYPREDGHPNDVCMEEGEQPDN